MSSASSYSSPWSSSSSSSLSSSAGIPPGGRQGPAQHPPCWRRVGPALKYCTLSNSDENSKEDDIRQEVLKIRQKKLTPQDIQQEASGIKRRTRVKKKGLDERLGDASFLRPSGEGEDFGSSDTDFWLKSLRWLIQKKPSFKFKRPGLRVGGKKMEKFRAFSVKGGGYACHKAFFFLPKSTY